MAEKAFARWLPNKSGDSVKEDKICADWCAWGRPVPSLALGNVKENMKRHLAMMREAKEQHVSIVTFPELSLTGYTCGDLFFQRRLLDDVTDALLALKDEMPEGILAVVGAPLEI